MKEIIFLIEVPSDNYTNGIAESNLRLFNNIKFNREVYFLKINLFIMFEFISYLKYFQ